MLYGQYEKLIVKLREEYARGYKNYIFRISSELFKELLERVGPNPTKIHLYDKFHLTDLIRIGYREATEPTVASRRLRLSTVSYGDSRFPTEEIKIFEHVENHATEKSKRRKYYGRSRKPKVISTVPSRMYYG